MLQERVCVGWRDETAKSRGNKLGTKGIELGYDDGSVAQLSTSFAA